MHVLCYYSRRASLGDPTSPHRIQIGGGDGPVPRRLQGLMIIRQFCRKIYLIVKCDFIKIMSMYYMLDDWGG